MLVLFGIDGSAGGGGPGGGAFLLDDFCCCWLLLFGEDEIKFAVSRSVELTPRIDELLSPLTECEPSESVP